MYSIARVCTYHKEVAVMHGFLWLKEIRDRWWLRVPAAIAAAMTLLLAGFVVGSLWAVVGVWPTQHLLAPLANSVFGIAYIGILLEGVLIWMMICTRFSVFMLIAFLAMPFFQNAKLGAYLWAFVPFMFYGWFFATMYLTYH